jgi:ParB family transcriptional regulator, chromosome partitioning protein
MIRPKALGRGLDALLGREGEQATLPRESLATLALHLVQPGRYQPRTHMDEASLAELAQSIQRQGLIQPILVRSLDERPGYYEIIAGERRWRAAQMAGLSEVPVVIRDVPDQAALAIALIENIQREDLNPLEEARGVQRLIGDFNLTHQEAAEAIGRSRTAVTNLLRLLSLPERVQGLLLEGHLDMGHARALLAAEAATCVRLAEDIVKRGLSVRQTEALMRSAPRARATAAAAPARVSRDIQRLEEEIAGELGTTVEIKATPSGSGKLILHYASLDHLDDLLARLRRRAEA